MKTKSNISSSKIIIEMDSGYGDFRRAFEVGETSERYMKRDLGLKAHQNQFSSFRAVRVTREIIGMS